VPAVVGRASHKRTDAMVHSSAGHGATDTDVGGQRLTQ